MRIVFLNTDYAEFTRWFYATNPGLERESYDGQMAARSASLFGAADFYTRHMRALGHEAWDIHANNPHMQAAWARENGIDAELHTGSVSAVASHGRGRGLRDIPLLAPVRRVARRIRGRRSRLPAAAVRVLRAQLQALRPDVVVNMDMGAIRSDFLRELKADVRLVVGQIASPLPEGEDFSTYDMVISALPNIVDHFRGHGIHAQLSRCAFEPAVLEQLARDRDPVDVSFVGALSPAHAGRIRWLESISRLTRVDAWGPGAGELPPDSPILPHHHGEAWGRDMYEVLAASGMTLNHHIDAAGDFANNMRLFEATGVGTCLITDAKSNLADMFVPGREVLTYRDERECAELILLYAGNAEERRQIARAGQARTLRDHGYSHRMRELSEHLARRL
jgi:spore maturation protein CgeB